MLVDVFLFSLHRLEPTRHQTNSLWSGSDSKMFLGCAFLYAIIEHSKDLLENGVSREFIGLIICNEGHSSPFYFVDSASCFRGTS